ncbi:deoxyhypusine synthase family protein [Candidatus Micrarchaeota archaeon]|nr:deoxyhypusine synthase family protein [Candidatus Micrarchaeota archaeon]
MEGCRVDGKGVISKFMERNYRHFNAAELLGAAAAYKEHVESGGKMLLAMAGAMSTAELGISLAKMIREGKVHAISTTGANLEEDLFNLIAHNDYAVMRDYRDLTPQDELGLMEKGLNRVTDTCIPEEKAMRRLERELLPIWKNAQEKGIRAFPHEYIYELIRSGKLSKHCQIDPADSWLLAACEKNLPIFVPGWADSSLGNYFVAEHIGGTIKNTQIMKEGLEYMKELVGWYEKESAACKMGFFQIGGGIAGDFPICVVPLINQDLKRSVPLWEYFAQISDSTTSYGSYSGAVPNEKITWGKLSPQTKRFMVESDATIVAPLIFSYVLGE